MPVRDGQSAGAGAELPGLDQMLGFWTSWVQAVTRAAPGSGGPGAPWWPPSPGDATAAGIRQLEEALRNSAGLHAIEQTWNAHPFKQIVPLDWAEIAHALRTVWLRSLRDPAETMSSLAKLNMDAWQAAVGTWNDAARRWWGVTSSEPPPSEPASDKRFAAPEWLGNPLYATLRNLYLLASDWLLHRSDATDIPATERQRLDFHLRQFVDAMSPTLLLTCNPAALRRAIETGGASLADGARNLLSDMAEGRLSMVDATAFAPGRNLALTPGKVVHRNRLIELIQYVPTTSTAHRVPLLIIPPWINKYYILDLQPKNSMVRWLVAQGFTVFVVSWKNPDASMEDTTIEDYMDLGLAEASEVVREIVGSEQVNVMGYCIGGTLLAMSLALLAARGDERFNAATFMVSLQDFAKVGDSAVFLGEPTVDFIEQQMLERGYLDSREMSNMFNLLRSNDLIWSNVVNNYLMGNKPPAFDLLYWNSDGTRMARAAHSWYLRNTYVENNLVEPGKIRLKDEAIDLRRIALDIYAVGAEKDHIVPWDAAWRITQLVGGRVRFVLASSGHIAGIINPPGGKGSFWSNGSSASTPEQWRAGATRHDGSWWTDWGAWLAERSGEKRPPPPVGSNRHPPLQDAPGSYVLAK